MSCNSLFQAIRIAEQLIRHGDCKLVIAGGVNAQTSGKDRAAEATCLVALTSLQTAQEFDLPALARINLAQAHVPPDARRNNPTVKKEFDYRGATGAAELVAALDQVESHGNSVLLAATGNGRPAKEVWTIAPARTETGAEKPRPSSSKVYAYVQDTPIYCGTPVLFPDPPSHPDQQPKNRKLLVLSNRRDTLSSIRQTGSLELLGTCTATVSFMATGADVSIDLASEERLADSLRALDGLGYDTILAVDDFSDDRPDSLLAEDWTQKEDLLDLLFAVCRRDYERIRDGRICVVSLSLGAIKNNVLAPGTGMAGGFMKSLARELAEANIRTVVTDEADFARALRHVATELGQPAQLGEVCYEGGKRHVFRLRRLDDMARDERPYLDRDSVVLATGGVRGVTAVLVEELLDRFGCTVIAIGRTELTEVPERILAMGEQALKQFEPEFYQEELARDRSQHIRELKRRFAAYQGANEVRQVLNRMQVLAPGRYTYRPVDLNRSDSIDEVVESIFRDHRRLDLVLHGAGVQVSTMLPKKTLAEFRRIVSTKLGGLGHIHRAVERRQRERPTHYHIVTSAFSYMGNDGQPDYGAANETMNRIAAVMNDPTAGCHWSSMAWLGWAGIGMTRGSEFAALAASRRLRGVTREEGRTLFAELMRGTPSHPINVLMADGEISHYGVVLADPAPRDDPGAHPSRQRFLRKLRTPSSGS